MISNQYQELIRENFDLSDSTTRKTIVALEDAEQNQLIGALASALYDKIVEKVDKIDFGTIPASRGDITKVQGFANTEECLNIIRKMVVEYKQNTVYVDTILTTINNIKDSKVLFMRAFDNSVQFPMVLYNLLVMSIEQSVSLMIAMTIQYVKDPSNQSLSAAFDKVAYNNTKSNMLYDQLVKFNISYKNGEITSLLRDVLSKGGKVTEAYCGETMPDTVIPPEGEDVTRVTVVAKYDNNSDEEVPAVSPFSDEEPSACDNNAPECSDDEVPCPGSDVPPVEKEEPECDPTPIMPVNGSCCAKNEEASDEGLQEGKISDMIDAAKNVGRAGKEVIDIARGKLDKKDAKFSGATKVFGTLGVIAGGITIGAIAFKGARALIKIVIPFLRSVSYFYYNSRVTIQDALEVQSHLIEMNAYKLQYSTTSTLSDEKKEKTIQRQLKISEKFHNLAQKFAIDKKKAEKDAIKMASDEDKKYKINDLKDNLPSEIVVKGDLF